MKSRALRLAVITLVSTLALTGCGGDGDKDKDKDAKKGDSAATDDGFTDPGVELQLGAPATIKWEPKADLEAEATITVTRLDRTTMADFAGFKLDDAMKQSTPYYVRVSVENKGEADLSGIEIPLYLDNGSAVLTPRAVVTSAFAPCPSQPLPAGFVKGQVAELCLVYLAGAGTELKAIALRPSETVEPITWTGPITDVVPPPAKKGSANPSPTG